MRQQAVFERPGCFGSLFGIGEQYSREHLLVLSAGADQEEQPGASRHQSMVGHPGPERAMSRFAGTCSSPETSSSNAPSNAVLVIENGQLDTNGYSITTSSGSGLTVVFSGTNSGSYTHAPTGGGTLDISSPTSGRLERRCALPGPEPDLRRRHLGGRQQPDMGHIGLGLSAAFERHLQRSREQGEQRPVVLRDGRRQHHWSMGRAASWKQADAPPRD